MTSTFFEHSIYFFIQVPPEAHQAEMGFRCCVEGPLVAFGCYMVFRRVVVCLTYSAFHFSLNKSKTKLKLFSPRKQMYGSCQTKKTFTLKVSAF